VQRLADKVELSTATIEAFKEFRNYLLAQEIYVSDRRWRKLVKLMKVSAFTSGFTETSIYDTWILPHCLWEQPGQFEGLQELYKRLVTFDGETPSFRLMRVIKAWETKLKEDQLTHKQISKGCPLYPDRKGDEVVEEVSKYHKKNNDGDLLYWDDDYKKETTYKYNPIRRRDNKPIFDEVKNTPIPLSSSFSQVYIEGRVREIQSLTSSVETHYNHLNKVLSEVSGYFDNHLWLDKHLLSEVTNALKNSIKESDQLLKRVVSLESGFKDLLLEKPQTLVLESSKSDVIEGEMCD
jgi:MoxR-like ATPase